MSPQEARQIQAYLQETLGNTKLRVKLRSNAADSAEFLLGNEFLGVIYRDEDEGEVSFQLSMAILPEDLPSA